MDNSGPFPSMTDAEKRQAALNSYQIMDTPPEAVFDDLTYLTSFICGTPIALVSLLDVKRQWFKSSVGLSVSETILEHAFCIHAIKQEKVFIVEDASKDARFSSNPLVTGDPHIRFYAGAPLTSPEGVPLGTLCAIDRVPRELTMQQSLALSALSRQVMLAMEMRRSATILRIALEEKEAAKIEVKSLQALIPMCAWCRQVRDEKEYWQSVERYLSEHTHSKYEQGICPSCADKFKSDQATQATRH